MFHETSTIRLSFDSAKWDLLTRQIRLARNQGIDPNEIYHSFDRFSGSIRKKIHEIFIREGMTIDDPLYKRHINPYDEILSNEADMDEGYHHKAFVDRRPEKDGKKAFKVELPMEDSKKKIDKNEFSRQFKASGMDAFAQMFMTNATPLEEPRPEPDQQAIIDEEDEQEAEPIFGESQKSKSMREISDILGLQF